MRALWWFHWAVLLLVFAFRLVFAFGLSFTAVLGLLAVAGGFFSSFLRFLLVTAFLWLVFVVKVYHESCGVYFFVKMSTPESRRVEISLLPSFYPRCFTNGKPGAVDNC